MNERLNHSWCGAVIWRGRFGTSTISSPVLSSCTCWSCAATPVWPNAVNGALAATISPSGSCPGAERLALQIEGNNPLKLQLKKQEEWVGDGPAGSTPITALLVSETLSLKAEGRQAVLVERLEKELERLQGWWATCWISPDWTTPWPATAGHRQPSTPGTSSARPGPPCRNWRSRGASASTSSPSAIKPEGCVDPARLHQALFNMIDNACATALTGPAST